MGQPKIAKTDLAARADKARGVERGLEGLNILIYGWLKFRKYRQSYSHVIHNRNWLYLTEVRDLQEYAQCNLV